MPAVLKLGGNVTQTMIEQYQPDNEMAEKLSASRDGFTKRVFGCLYDSDDSTDVSDLFNVIGKEG